MTQETHSRPETAHRTLRVTAAALAVVMLLVSSLSAPAAAQNNETNPCEFGPPVPGQDTRTETFEVVLVNDRTNSMSAGDRMQQLQDATKAFVGGLEEPQEVGMASFGKTSRLDINLTTDYAAVNASIDSLQPDSEFGNAFDEGIRDGMEVLLNRSNATDGVPKALVFATDGDTDSAQDREDAIEAASDAESHGITVFTVAVGQDANLTWMEEVATEPQFAYNGSNVSDLDAIYQKIEEDVTAIDSGLRVDTRPLFKPGATHPYEVMNVTYIVENNETVTIREDVTEEANLTSSNTSILSVDEANKQLVATEDADIATWVRVDASTGTETGCTNVIVAQPTVENLKLVPGIHRIEAIAGDSTLFALLIATLLAVPAARFTSAFGGLAMAQMVVVVAWFAGYINFGIAAASLFVALFIGLNLAANIDYQAGNLGRR